MNRISRRKALKLGAIASGSFLLPVALHRLSYAKDGGTSKVAISSQNALSFKDGSSPKVKPFTLRFRTPPVLKPVHSDETNKIDYYEIDIRKAQVEILPGLKTEIWGYNGIIPGPTIIQRKVWYEDLQKYRQSVVRFTNNTGDLPTSVHLHGMASLPQYDGYAEDLTPPGYYKDYYYPNNRAATLWYHDHAIHATAHNVYMGLAATYLVVDEYEDSLNLPKGDYDVPLMIQDKQFAPDGSLIFDDNGQKGVMGDVILVNGVPWPRMEVANRKYRFRVLNGSVARSYKLALSTGDEFTMIGSDGGLMSTPVKVKNFRIGMAERYEFVIDFSKYPIGTQIVLQNLGLPNNKDYDSTRQIMRFDVVRRETDTSTIPSTLRYVQPIPASSAVRTRKFTYERSNGLWQINGKIWDENRVDANPKLDDVEIWELRNEAGGWFHPIHLHLIDCQMLDRNGKPPFAYERGWKDVFYVGENETVRVIGKFSPNTGKYMTHCHNTVHEDHDMMTQFEVGQSTPNNDPMSARAKPLPAPPLFRT